MVDLLAFASHWKLILARDSSELTDRVSFGDNNFKPNHEFYFGTQSRPPESSLLTVSWCKLINLVWILHSHSLYKDCGTFIVDDDIVVWRIWECTFFVEEMNSWLDSFTQNLALKIDGNWLGFRFDDHDLKLSSRLCTIDNTFLVYALRKRRRFSFFFKDSFGPIFTSEFVRLLQDLLCVHLVGLWRLKDEFQRPNEEFIKMETTSDQCCFLSLLLSWLDFIENHSSSRCVTSQGELWSSRFTNMAALINGIDSGFNTPKIMPSSFISTEEVGEQVQGLLLVTVRTALQRFLPLSCCQFYIGNQFNFEAMPLPYLLSSVLQSQLQPALGEQDGAGDKDDLDRMRHFFAYPVLLQKQSRDCWFSHSLHTHGSCSLSPRWNTSILRGSIRMYILGLVMVSLVSVFGLV
ncbi:hypothetical protein ISN44_As11g013380 [Arabidopsis suecica]|uniref:Uncharacterized protein n=1 Tax=Arabidopsis suecica TaxID=45249 RepID=A0A8T1ZA84_ARASU|nr:hypothetical protein ISN44_As11g013380 [Arabidopsis suecica]